MDDEDLANVLRSTANVGLPGFSSNNDPTPQPVNDDPFANPFANPFASSDAPTFPTTVSGSGFQDESTASGNDTSPYVTKLREEGTIDNDAGFGYQSGYDTGYKKVESSSGFGDSSYSQAYEQPRGITDPARTPFEVPTFTSAPFGTTSPLRTATYSRSNDPFSSPGRSFHDPYGIPRSPPPPAAASGTTSPARMRPSSDILGLLSEEDTSTSSLKKAFVASDNKRDSTETKPNPASAASVFKPGGNAARKKVGISFDSVQREREKREKEERERAATAEAKRKEERERDEREKADRAKTGDSKDIGHAVSSNQPAENLATKGAEIDPPDGRLNAGENTGTTGAASDEHAEPISSLVAGDSVLEKAARDAASPTPPGPHVSAAMAAQILESSHPDQASQRVAETIARHKDEVIHSNEVVPEHIPLPSSGVASPAIASRASSPSPERSHSPRAIETDSVTPLPLDSDKKADTETLFKALAIGGSSQSEAPVPEAFSPQTESSMKNARWGRAFEDTEVSGPSASRQQQLPEPLGWTTETHVPQQPLYGSSYSPRSPPAWQSESDRDNTTRPSGPYAQRQVETHESEPQASYADLPGATEPIRSPTRNRLLTQPVFTISISDPTKVGDPVRGYIVYTVTTRTTSPHYKRGEFSVLRRFSDFLWLVEAVSHNNPGVVVPPMPDKHAFGRFEEQFVETRRSALERALGKMANHPVLSLDPDLKLFLSSDAFAIDVKHRRQEMTQEKQSVLASLGGSIGGPRFVEQDDWFNKQKYFLDSLESQIKALVKSLEASSKHRLDLVNGFLTLSDALQALAESDLSLALSQVLQRFSQLSEDERLMHENQAKMDVVRLLNVADEQLRLIGSVRAAFSSRIRSHFAWQNAQSEARRVRVQSERDRAKKGGKYAPQESNGPDTPDIAQADRRALDAQSDFDAVSRLVKLEFSRFEQERIEDLKSTMEAYITEAVDAQQKLVQDWEAFHKELSGILAQHQRTS